MGSSRFPASLPVAVFGPSPGCWHVSPVPAGSGARRLPRGLAQNQRVREPGSTRGARSIGFHVPVSSSLAVVGKSAAAEAEPRSCLLCDSPQIVESWNSLGWAVGAKRQGGDRENKQI